MENYRKLELDILSCLLQRPELMEQVKFEDKHIVNYKQLWQFMKSFYNKFKNFDLTLMTSVSQNKYKIIDYIILLIDREPAPSRFNLYQNLLIELYEEKKSERFLKDRIYKLATDLYVGNLTIGEFEIKMKSAYTSAGVLFDKNE